MGWGAIRRIEGGAQAATHRIPGACRGLPLLGRRARARASTLVNVYVRLAKASRSGGSIVKD